MATVFGGSNPPGHIILMTNYQVFFISYNESNQEKNWIRCKTLHPDAIRIHGVTGIDRVHVACDSLATTEYFWTVDGDNWLLEPLTWTEPITVDLLMFHAVDPITRGRTKLGGVKLWHTGHMINKDMSKGDFCLNATAEKLSPEHEFSETRYNATPYEAWKTAFRHCVKLLSVIIQSRPLAESTNHYLEQWRNCQNLNNGKNNAIWCYQGYLDAEEYVRKYDNNFTELYKINDYDWLKNHFKQLHET